MKLLSCVRPYDSMDCSPQASLSMGFSRQEWVAVSFSRGSSWPRDRTQVSNIAGRCFTLWVTRRFLNMHRTDEIWGHYVKWNKPVTKISIAWFHLYEILVVVVQSPSHVQLFPTPWTGACQASLSLTISQSLPKFMFITLVMPSSHLILWCPLLLPLIFPSIRNYSNELSVYIRWPKYWSFSYSIHLSSEYSGLISLKIYWFDLLVLQGILSSTTVWRHQWFGILPSLWSRSQNSTRPLGRP